MRWTVLGFDLDGTLVDTAGEIAEAANAALVDAGLAARPTERIAGLIGSGTRELLRRLLEQAHSPLPFEALAARFDARYAAIAGTRARPYAGAGEALARLRRGGVRLACVTNKDARFVAPVLEAARLARSFDLVVAGDTLPERKPHPSVLAHVLTRLGAAPSQVAHVGDSRIDVACARNAGVAAWAVPWGYNAGEPIERSAPDRVFTSLGEIADVVLAANASEAAR